MGKQMTKILKHKAQELYNRYPEKFTDNYKENKEKVKEAGIFEYSKTDRNLVVGYITRLKTEEKKE